MIVLRQVASGERGSALISGILVSAIVLVLGLTVLGYSIYSNNVSSDDRTRSQALLAADAAVTEAIRRLEVNFPAAGICTGPASPPADLVDGSRTIARYRYQVASTPGDPTCLTNRRLLRAWGYGGGSTRVVRQVELVVQVTNSSGFNRALLAGGTLTLEGESDVTGDIHAGTIAATWERMNQNAGDLATTGAITTQPNDSFAGDLWAGTAVTLGNNTMVAGGVVASNGSVSLPTQCSVAKAIQAAGTISGTCSPNGGYAPGSKALPPPAVPLPTFAYSPANYNPAPMEITSVAAANSMFNSLAVGSMAGTFRITDPSATPDVLDLTNSWTIVGPTTIIADTNAFGVAPRIRLSGTWQSSCTCQLVVISLSNAPDAIEIDADGLDLPGTGLSTLLFGRGGVDATGRVRTMFGSIYGGSVRLRDDVRIQAQADLAGQPPPGFTFPVSSARQWTVQAELDGWKEIPNAVLPPGS